MKIKKIIALCKNAGQLILYSDPSRNIQWLSDGIAIYPLQGCPIFDEDSFCNTYEISDTQRSKISFRINEPLPSTFDFNDAETFETETEKMPLSVSYSTYNTVAYKTQYGVEFINKAHLQPFSDYSSSDISITLRTNEIGQTYFAVKNGFMLVGLILPLEIIDRSFLSELKAFLTQVEITLYNVEKINPDNSQFDMSEVTNDEEEI